MIVPTDEEIRALHERHAPTEAAFELVYTHCEIVCGIAEQLLSGGAPGVDADLVRAGALLHDIGVYRLYDDTGRMDEAGYIRHGILGHELLRDEGLSAVLRRFCSCHTGVGITRDDVRRQELPLPVADYVAESREEELVMYADKFHTKSDPPAFLSAASYAARLRRFGEDKVARFEELRERYGTPDLAPLAAAYGHRAA
ncbi:HDIG domain-containing protein [Actinoallomurus spadix]|uniref:HD domain-containing protein n=1 Tax=Actinoallomurus spadix TaxID=79912 RepID=A0ABN0WW46_9ACTN|nr:HDIG domain-containing metalloprotein [Actinoallomurus spadix]MCO5986625.1 HDIG domain-containing protein [Actinoallomurus spadix]